MPVQQMANCCGCVRLKAGALIISILWLIDGLIGSLSNIFVLASKEIIDFTDLVTDSSRYNRGFSILPAILYLLIAFGAVFGLFAITLAYGIAGAEIVVHAYMIILIIVHRSSIMKECERYIETTSPEFGYACPQGYNYTLTFNIAYAIVVILLSVYFAMVVSAYARKTREETETQKEQAE
ncbi:13978_t:CDS:2 [Funneliformis mosseae]|uniref:13978_t:CDS:1 n=1 Tax=Funneliformis mosseae TaxID=27381 RepID=A0A9N8Z7I5_FUNMO|nr:13978_t:CDS:2 [Funneliformis mosseae]